MTRDAVFLGLAVIFGMNDERERAVRADHVELGRELDLCGLLHLPLRCVDVVRDVLLEDGLELIIIAVCDILDLPLGPTEMSGLLQYPTDEYDTPILVVVEAMESTSSAARVAG